MGHRQRGISLIEVMVTLSVVAILAAVAAPSFQSARDNSQMKGGTTALAADIEWARSQAIADATPTTVYFNPGANWCYGIDNDGACDCTNPASCSLKVVDNQDFNLLTLNNDTFGGSVTFGVDGVPDVNGNTGFAVNGQNSTVAVNPIGRVTVTLP